MRTRGYFLSVHADAEWGTPRTQAVGELTKVGEEPNMYGGRMAKAMNIDSRREIKRESEESKRPRETMNSEP